MAVGPSNLNGECAKDTAGGWEDWACGRCGQARVQVMPGVDLRFPPASLAERPTSSRRTGKPDLPSCAWQAGAGHQSDACLLTLEQVMQPRGMPPLMGSVVRAYVASQVRKGRGGAGGSYLRHVL